MSRHEFPVSVKKAALARSGGRCEAIGVRYGYQPGERCERPVAPGKVHFDHYPRGAHDPDPETRTLGNCVATCPECNMRAAYTVDIPTEAKIKRVQRKHGLREDTRKPRPKIKTRANPWQQGRKIPTKPMRNV